MIASYTFTTPTYNFFDKFGVLIDRFYLPDSYLSVPAVGVSSGVIISEDDGKHNRFISLGEIIAMGLTDIATFTAQFNSDKSGSILDGVRISSPGGGVDSQSNIAIGYVSGTILEVGGESNVLIGNHTGSGITTGDRNTAIGNNSLRNGGDLTGSFNTSIGDGAMNGTRGNSKSNTAIGVSALGNGELNGGRYNTAVGSYSLLNISTGDSNIGIGFKTGYYNFTGDNNVFIGKYAGYYETGSNTLHIGNEFGVSPLIHGNFTSKILTVNTTLVIAPQTATAASALTPVEGMMVNVSNTNGTFTSTGSWIYEGGSWGKITVV